jgi:hypothetical protein
MFKALLQIATLSFLLINPIASVACEAGEMSRTARGFIKKIVSGSNEIVAYYDANSLDETFKLDLLRPYFVICTESGYFRISDVEALTVAEAIAGNVGYVRIDQVFEWPTSEGLSFF